MKRVPEGLRANLTNVEFAQLVTEADRLRAVNAELLAALVVAQKTIRGILDPEAPGFDPEAEQIIAAAITKAKGAA